MRNISCIFNLSLGNLGSNMMKIDPRDLDDSGHSIDDKDCLHALTAW